TTNSPPIDIDLIPGEPVPSRGRMSMMIVVPALSKSDPSHPPIVPGIVARSKTSASPHVGCGIDQPGSVKPQDHTQAEPPGDKGQSTEHIQAYTDKNHWPHVETIQPTLKSVAHQIRRVATQNSLRMLLGPSY